VREEERRLLREEERGQMRVLLQSEEPRLEQRLFRSQECGRERTPSLRLQRRLLRMDEQGPLRGEAYPGGPPPSNYPPQARS